jgi:transposase
VFVNSESTLYLVDQGRGRSVVTELLGADFAGVLVSDCLAIYDDATALQQKCYAHHHKAIRQAKALHPHQGEGFLNEVTAMLRAAVALQAQKAECDPESFHTLRQALEGTASRLLDSARTEPSEEAVRNRLAKQRDHLFTFLDHDGVDATNNLAERQLRPAVIARKVSCGNKTPKGARTWQILASQATTCTQRATSFIDALARARPVPSAPKRLTALNMDDLHKRRNWIHIGGKEAGPRVAAIISVVETCRRLKIATIWAQSCPA